MLGWAWQICLLGSDGLGERGGRSGLEPTRSLRLGSTRKGLLRRSARLGSVIPRLILLARDGAQRGPGRCWVKRLHSELDWLFEATSVFPFPPAFRRRALWLGARMTSNELDYMTARSLARCRAAGLERSGDRWCGVEVRLRRGGKAGKPIRYLESCSPQHLPQGPRLR